MLFFLIFFFNATEFGSDTDVFYRTKSAIIDQIGIKLLSLIYNLQISTLL